MRCCLAWNSSRPHILPPPPLAPTCRRMHMPSWSYLSASSVLAPSATTTSRQAHLSPHSSAHPLAYVHAFATTLPPPLNPAGMVMMDTSNCMGMGMQYWACAGSRPLVPERERYNLRPHVAPEACHRARRACYYTYCNNI